MRLALLSIASLALAQTPQFNVATIKPAAPSTDGRSHTRISTDTDTGKLNYLNVNLKDIIGQAYKVQQYQIAGPPWIDTDRFDIVARFPAPLRRQEPAADTSRPFSGPLQARDSSRDQGTPGIQPRRRQGRAEIQAV